MNNFKLFNERMHEIYDTKNIREWIGAFETAMSFMCQAIEKHIRETTGEFPCIEKTELHLLNYQNENYPNKYDAEKNIYSFSTRLPSLKTITATTQLKAELEKRLRETGWNHLFITVHTFEKGNHVIAQKIS